MNGVVDIWSIMNKYMYMGEKKQYKCFGVENVVKMILWCGIFKYKCVNVLILDVLPYF